MAIGRSVFAGLNGQQHYAFSWALQAFSSGQSRLDVLVEEVRKCCGDANAPEVHPTAEPKGSTTMAIGPVISHGPSNKRFMIRRCGVGVGGAVATGVCVGLGV